MQNMVHLHDEVANERYTIYDFFLPGLTIHTLKNKTKRFISWAKKLSPKDTKQ
jgi:sucrose phosphorylase